MFFPRKRADGTLISPRVGGQEMELGGVMAGVGITAAPPLRGGGAAAAPGSALPGPPPLNTSAAMLAMARAGVKLSKEQLKGLSKDDKKAAKRARKEAKKVGIARGVSVMGGQRMAETHDQVVGVVGFKFIGQSSKSTKTFLSFLNYAGQKGSEEGCKGEEEKAPQQQQRQQQQQWRER